MWRSLGKTSLEILRDDDSIILICGGGGAILYDVIGERTPVDLFTLPTSILFTLLFTVF